MDDNSISNTEEKGIQSLHTAKVKWFRALNSPDAWLALLKLSTTAEDDQPLP